MRQMLVRERLLEPLRQRHRVAVVALEAPAGFGRSVLLDQVRDEGPTRSGDQDVWYSCGPDDALPGRLATGLLAACRASADAGSGDWADADVASRAVAEGLGRRTTSSGHVALIVDGVECTGASGDAFLPLLLARLPERCHLVLSGRRLPRMGLARHIVSGTGLLLDTADLAFRDHERARLCATHPELGRIDADLAAWPAVVGLVVEGRPELVTDYLVECVLDEVDPAVARALAALAVVGGSSDALLDAVVDAVEGIGDPPRAAIDRALLRTELHRIPLSHTDGGFWPHPVWADATATLLTDAERTAAIGAKARGLVGVGAINDSGRLALRTGSVAALDVVLRAALSTQPPLASLDDLQRWAAAGLLATGSTADQWLRTVIDLQLGDRAGDGAARLESVRRAFEAVGDDGAETSVLLHLGHLARARSDVGELVRLLGRGEELAARGSAAAQGLVALGRAVAAQVAGDPTGAIRELDRIPTGSLVGEWAAQTLMIRGTNLLLAGHRTAAVRSLEAATGEGSDASRAVAHDLLAAARWYAGDPVGALRDAMTAELLAARAGTPALLQRVRATRACFLAVSGQRDAALALTEQIRRHGPIPDAEEAGALLRLADAFLLADAGDLDGARTVTTATATVTRAVRSSVWKAALDAALAGDGEPVADDRHEDWALRQAVTAGRAAARHLAGGPPAEERHRPYLPARWCHQAHPPLTVTLRGDCRVERDFRPVDHPAWGRSRVRELCLHLALVGDRNRAGVAASLWPDRADRSAGQNLRVTLAHLLDVLDPDRARAQGTPWIVEGGGSLRFNRDVGLRIDLWDAERHAEAILASPAYERPALLAHARRLVAEPHGPLLGGLATGEWVEPHRRRLDDLVGAACLHAGAQALAAGDHELAEALGGRALEVDPWSEGAHRLVVDARLGGGDLDGARRGLHQALSALDDLGAAPAPATVVLTHRAGLTLRPGRSVLART